MPSDLLAILSAAVVAHHALIPRTLHVSRRNHRVDFARIGVDLAEGETSLPAERAFYVGVSGFGFGGLNAHAVLRRHLHAVDAEAALLSADGSAASGMPLLLPLSSHSHDSLRAVAAHLAAHLEQKAVGLSEAQDASYAAAICRGTIFGRSHAAGACLPSKPPPLKHTKPSH